jgi:S-adenosylhomocysteine hydrolase
MSERAKRNISKKHADFSGEKHPNFGKHHVFSIEARKRMSDAHVGKNMGHNVSEAARKKISIAAKKRFENPEERERLRLANLGKKASLETRIKMSASKKGHPGYMTGKHHTKETCKKISLSMTGKTYGPHSEERRKNISVGIHQVYPEGRKLSIEQRKNIQMGLLRHYHPERNNA